VDDLVVVVVLERMAEVGDVDRGRRPEDEDEREWVRARLAPLVGVASQGGAEREESFAAWRGMLEAIAATRPLVLIGVLGAALLYGDGIITPAISVLSAVEGLEVATPALKRFVIPITVAILVALFVIQRRGTARVGAVFGPVVLVWFLAIAAVGVGQIAGRPEVLRAVSPAYAVSFLASGGLRGALVAGWLFVLPGFLSILALSVLYVHTAELPAVAAALLGLKAAVLDELPSRTEVARRIAPYPEQRAFYEAVRRRGVEHMATLAGLAQREHGPARDHFAAVLQEHLDQVLEVAKAWLAVDQGHTVGLPSLCGFHTNVRI
jgi:hypothetical protein